MTAPTPYRSQFLNYNPANSMTGQQVPNLASQMGTSKPDGYNPYAAGPKRYGISGTMSPNSGPVSATGMEGYANREQKASVARQASLNMLKAQQSGKFASPEWLGGQVNNGR